MIKSTRRFDGKIFKLKSIFITPDGATRKKKSLESKYHVRIIKGSLSRMFSKSKGKKEWRIYIRKK